MEKYLYEDVKKISKEKGLYLISEKYNNEEDFLEYKDKNGYKYRYRFCDIKIKTTSKLNTWSTNNPYSTYNKMIFMKNNVKLIRISYIDIDNCKYENILKSIL